jgi:hypothetical protein
MPVAKPGATSPKIEASTNYFPTSVLPAGPDYSSKPSAGRGKRLFILGFRMRTTNGRNDSSIGAQRDFVKVAKTANRGSPRQPSPWNALLLHHVPLPASERNLDHRSSKRDGHSS